MDVEVEEMENDVYITFYDNERRELIGVKLSKDDFELFRKSNDGFLVYTPNAHVWLSLSLREKVRGKQWRKES